MATMQANRANVNNKGLMTLTPQQVASLPPQDQQRYLARMSPAEQALVADAQQQMIVDANRMFMRKSLRKTAYCPVTGGSGVTAAYTAGQTLYFDFPTVPGYATDVLITYNLTVTPASGSSAVYATNPAAPFNIFSELQVLLNGPQIRTHPFFLSLVDQLRGLMRGPQNRVLAGNNDATIAGQLVGQTPVVAGSGNTWQGKLKLRLNPLGRDTVPGVLPISGTGNKPQLKLTCAPNPVGYDPLLNPIAPVSGTGHGATITGNINVDVVYVDGVNMDSPTALPDLQWQYEPTMQYTWDTALTPFLANVLNPQTISSKLKHWYVISIMIDGLQANQFATPGNIVGFRLAPDQVGNNAFVNWNISNNVSIYDFFEEWVREIIGQDLPNGVIPWVCGPIRGITNATNRHGLQYLNMYAEGFPAATHTYQVSSVTPLTPVAGFTAPTPRVETFLISENRSGLQIG